MSVQPEILSTIRRNIPRLAMRYGLRRIGIFGSYARGAQRPDSDVDLIVEFDRALGLEFMDFVNEMEKILGKKTDILTAAGVSAIRNKSIVSDIEKSVIYV